jgi:hypothetical protein
MRYAPPGMCLNDFAVLGPAPYVLLHLQGPWTPEFDATRMETSYGRARSVDLLEWETCAPVFGVGLPGRFDDSAVWTMHPFPHGDGLAMAYTGVTRRDGLGQAIGMAFSDRTDGTGWRRASPGPVTTPDPRWYRVGEGEAWRDPWIVANTMPGAKWTMFTAARAASLPASAGGCVGLATSDDLLNWEVHPSPLVPGNVDELECPILEPVDGGWLMLASLSPERHISAWRSAEITGPWEPLGPIAPDGIYAPRLIDGPDGERLVLHTVPRRFGLRDDGPWCRGMLAQPKRLVHTENGPRLAWWPRIERLLGEYDDPGGILGDALIEATLNRLPATLSLRNGLHLTVTDRQITLFLPDGATNSAGLTGTPRSLKIFTLGEFIEIYADDLLVLATATYGPRTEEISAPAGARIDLKMRPIRPSTSGRDDVSAIWPGDHIYAEPQLMS